MAITITQGWSLGKLDGQSAELLYVCECAASDTPAQVRSAMLAAAGASYNGLPRIDVECSVEHKKDTLYIGRVVFRRQTPKTRLAEAAGPVISFDTTGGTQHVTQSKGTTRYAPSGKTAPDFQGAIGYDGEKVAGVDIGMGVYRFSEQWELAASTVTAAYRATLKNLTFRVNSATFRGFDAGEVLFEGAVGRRVPGEKFSVTFSFAVSSNAANVAVGDITVAAKKGWQYLWAYHAKATDQGFVVERPVAAYVETVYDSGDFSGLGIGTGTL